MSIRIDDEDVPLNRASDSGFSLRSFLGGMRTVNGDTLPTPPLVNLQTSSVANDMIDFPTEVLYEPPQTLANMHATHQVSNCLNGAVGVEQARGFQLRLGSMHQKKISQFVQSGAVESTEAQLKQLKHKSVIDFTPTDQSPFVNIHPPVSPTSSHQSLHTPYTTPPRPASIQTQVQYDSTIKYHEHQQHQLQTQLDSVQCVLEEATQRGQKQAAEKKVLFEKARVQNERAERYKQAYEQLKQDAVRLQQDNQKLQATLHSGKEVEHTLRKQHSMVLEESKSRIQNIEKIRAQQQVEIEAKSDQLKCATLELTSISNDNSRLKLALESSQNHTSIIQELRQQLECETQTRDSLQSELTKQQSAHESVYTQLSDERKVHEDLVKKHAACQPSERIGRAIDNIDYGTIGASCIKATIDSQRRIVIVVNDSGTTEREESTSTNDAETQDNLVSVRKALQNDILRTMRDAVGRRRELRGDVDMFDGALFSNLS